MAKTKQKGSTLIEALVALVILTEVIMIAFGIMSATSKSARNTRYKMLCLGYAQDGVEKIRNIRDTSLNNSQNYNNSITAGTFRIDTGTSPYNFKTTSAASEDMGSGFSRRVNIFPVPSTIQVQSDVTYPGGKCSVSEQLTDWRK